MQAKAQQAAAAALQQQAQTPPLQLDSHHIQPEAAVRLQPGSHPTTPLQLQSAHSAPVFPGLPALDGLPPGTGWHTGLQDADLQLTAMASLMGVDAVQEGMLGLDQQWGTPFAAGQSPQWAAMQAGAAGRQAVAPSTPISRYDSLPELSSLQHKPSLASTATAFDTRAPPPPTELLSARPDFAVVYAFLGSLFDNALESVDHVKMLYQDLPVQDRRTVQLLLGNLTAALRRPETSDLYAKALQAQQGAHAQPSAQPSAEQAPA